MTKDKEKKTATGEKLFVESMPQGIHSLCAIGKKCEEAARKILADSSAGPLFRKISNEDYSQLAKAFESDWWDEEACKVLQLYAEELKKRDDITMNNLCRWILSHPNNSDAVRECLSTEPPDGIDIIRVLSQRGSQKIIFLATWHLFQRQVVLKRFLGLREAAEILFTRESLANPLFLKHPNINETYLHQNSKGEKFVVEEFLREVLYDGWRSNGILEAANLLYDICNAIHYIQKEGNLVHGDIKPDNIAKKSGRYVLLDFGICRPAGAFTPESTATGSLRTRPPELLLHPEDIRDPPLCQHDWDTPPMLN